MSIRRKNTTHDLATLRLHPDGSRVQQSSVNSRRRTARSTLVDSRGNWIAKDAGGKGSVKIHRAVSDAHTKDGESIDFSGDEEQRSQSKGKERARDSQVPDEDEHREPEPGRLNTRTKRRLSFLRDLSFLDPPLASVSSLEQDSDHSVTTSRGPIFSFPDPPSDLLKSIHHFASCYYRETGQLSNSSKDYRRRKRERRKKSPENIHTFATKMVKHEDIDAEIEDSEMEEITEEDEDEVMDTQDSGKGLRTKGDSYTKDMYKAFDGSALMAIGIVLQEYVAHTLSSGPHPSEEFGNPKRRRTE